MKSSLFAVLLLSVSLQSQTLTYEQVKAEMESYFLENPGAKGQKQFDRWKYFTENRLNEDGTFPDPEILLREWTLYKAEHARVMSTQSTANWQQWGPNPSFRVGRTQCLRQDPGNPLTWYLGTPASGLWKTTDGGINWTALTENMPILGVSDVAIHPLTSSTLYMACGDADAGTLNNVYSTGVMKSTDGGLNWSTTGLNWNFSASRRIGRLIINPDSANVLLAATSNGIYRTRDGGITWTQVRTGNHEDIEFHPLNSGIVYAGSSSQFLRSADGGYTWTAITSGVPATGNRVIVAVTPDNPLAVYCIFASSSAFTGLYKSTDEGLNFSTLPSTGVSSTVGPFPWYALTLAVSPRDEDMIAIGGVLATRTINGGTNWSSCGSENDYHDMMFWKNSKDSMFICNDKGIYRINNLTSTPTGVTNFNADLNLIMAYKMCISPAQPDWAFCGTQDNATYKLNTGTSSFSGVIFNADGGYCVTDAATGNFVLAQKEYGQLFKSTTGGDAFSYSACSPPSMANQGYFVTPVGLHTQNAQIVYAGYDEVWKSTDGASTWATVSSFPGSTDLREMTVAPSNGNVVYVSTGSNLWKTPDGGTTWIDLTGTLPFTSSLLDICIHSTDTSRIWILRGGFTAGGKVYYSSNGGLNWTNVSGTLPNVPANCLVHENNSVDGLYLGTDLGVYYRDNTMSDWVSYSTGLPVVIVNQLEIQYSTNKIVAGTMGRGIWISYLYQFTVGQEQEKDSKFIVFPNPSDGIFTVEKEGLATVYSMDGKIAAQLLLTKNQNKINLQSHPAGVYLLEVLSNGHIYRERLVLH
ncbi:MAG: T9SS type A sorting domain-containing protein [Bacteroidia bacterium]|nr:T9SS type A sorting domain-containing protein [Bacteroidia bacterium]